MIDKKQLNIQLKAKQQNNTFENLIGEKKQELSDFTAANKATLLGKNTGEVVGGFQSLETVTNGAADTPLGNAMVSMTDAVPGIAPRKVGELTNQFFDPEKIEMKYATPSLLFRELDSDAGIDSAAAGSLDSVDFSDPDALAAMFSSVETVGGGLANSVAQIISLITGLATIKKLTDIVSGGSALTDLKTMTEKAAEKSNSLLSDITSTLDAASGGELTELTDALQEGDITGIVQSASAIASLNPAVASANLAGDKLGIDIVSDVTGNTSLFGEANQLINKVNEVVSTVDQISTAVERGIGDTLAGAFNDIAGQASEFLSKTGINTGKGFLPNFAEDLYRNISGTIEQLTFGTNFNDNQLSELIQQSLSGNPTDRSKAIRTMLQNTTLFTPQMKNVINNVKGSKDLNEFMDTVEEKARAAGVSPEEIQSFRQRAVDIEVSLDDLDATISGSIVKSSADFFEEDVNLAELAARYQGAASGFSAFTYIESKEELAAEFAKVERDISEVIVHASETYTNANIGSEELHTFHNEKGFDGIQYHFVIRRDGKLQRGMTLDTTSQASNINNHNVRCIDVVLIGGLNCPSGTENPLTYRSAQSFTNAQMKTLESVLEAFYRRYPGGQVMGHNEIFDGALDPYFEVSEYVQNLFRKENVYEDLLNDTAYETKDLINQEVK